MKIVPGLFLLALAAASVAAQQPAIEPGNPEELRGVSTIHVAANSKSARAGIVREINRRLPQLKIASRPEEAEVWLVYTEDRRSFSKADPTSELSGGGSGSQSFEEHEVVASGSVFKPFSKDRTRRLLEFSDAVTSVLESRLSRNFARSFIQAYKHANGI